MTPRRYRKKPVIVSAYQTAETIYIQTLEGLMRAGAGDYIVTGIQGEHYPCKPQIFAATHEPIESPESEHLSRADAGQRQTWPTSPNTPSTLLSWLSDPLYAAPAARQTRARGSGSLFVLSLSAGGSQKCRWTIANWLCCSMHDPRISRRSPCRRPSPFALPTHKRLPPVGSTSPSTPNPDAGVARPWSNWPACSPRPPSSMRSTFCSSYGR